MVRNIIQSLTKFDKFGVQQGEAGRYRGIMDFWEGEEERALEGWTW